MRDFRQKWKLRCPKRWLHQKIAFLSSKTQKFSETSSIFECDNWQHQKQSNFARLVWKVDSWVQTWRPRANAFAVIPATKKWGQVIRSAAPATQNHLPKTEDPMRQNAPLRKSAPGPPNISDGDVSCAVPATENASLQILFRCPTPAIVFRNATKPSRLCHFWQGAESIAPAMQNRIQTSKSGPSLNAWRPNALSATTVCTFSTSQVPKVIQTCGVFAILTWQYASRHYCARFFNISTSKSAPTIRCF